MNSSGSFERSTGKPYDIRTGTHTNGTHMKRFAFGIAFTFTIFLIGGRSAYLWEATGAPAQAEATTCGR